MPRKLQRANALLWIGIAAGLVLLVLLSPAKRVNRFGFPAASTFEHDATGASGVFEIVQALGWKAERRTLPGLSGLERSVFVSLDAPMQLTPAETHVLLEQVRAGAGLLVNAERHTPILDSLLLRRDDPIQAPIQRGSKQYRCEESTDREIVGMGGRIYLRTVQYLPASPLAAASGSDLFELETPSFEGTNFYAARGVPFGRGKIVVVSSVDPFRNDVLRRCETNVAPSVIELFDYFTTNGVKPTVVFDEYRQGYGRKPQIWGAIGGVFSGTSGGRALLQIVAAGLIFIFAAAFRDLPPRVITRIERRSPFEHLSALAAAYSRAGATTLATKRLVQGLRRRNPAAAIKAEDSKEENFLDTIRAANPRVAPQVQVIRKALGTRTDASDLVESAKAIETIERSFHK